MDKENKINSEEIEKKSNSKKFNKKLIIPIILLIVIVAGCIIAIPKLTENKSDKPENPSKEVMESNTKYLDYRLSSNNLEKFDLYFLQTENEEKNKVYSPISIKYALNMLADGTEGKSKTQITSLIGDYRANKYVNSKNMSFANAMFIKDSYQSHIKDSYISNIQNKYNAEVIYDSFNTPDVLNNWVSKKTFNLIKNLEDDISDKDYILTNALAIDMEWKNKIQSETEDYIVRYDHISYSKGISALMFADYTGLEFEGYNHEAKSAEIGAVINKYDIVNTLGEENIRKTVGDEYQKWLDTGGTKGNCNWDEPDPDKETYLNNYIKEINKGYKDISSSTDFSFYVDDNTKVFAKDLKTYNGTTLEYIGIMPTKENLSEYIKNTNASDINSLINNLKDIKLENFKEGVLTEIKGYIPMFKFEYTLPLKEDLMKIGITDVFNPDKADLSNLTTDKAAFISEASHKTNIEFSNDGIKAAAVVELGGKGATSCGFDYIYDIPVEKIDLTFNRPFLFLIRDKDSKEVWFTGTVYEPVEFEPQEGGQ